MSFKILAILVEPADYTLDLIKNVYDRRGVDHIFLKGHSLASGDKGLKEALSEMHFIKRIKTIFSLMKEYDGFNINGYTGLTRFILICINIIFFKKPFSIDSDTELAVPRNIVKRLMKWHWLHFLFTRKYCYGFAGGNYGHKDLFRHYGMAEDRIYLAPMVVDNKCYSREVGMIDGRRRRTFRFGYLGRLVGLKQVDKVIEAVKMLVDEGYQIELYIVGDGTARIELEKIANGLPITFTGALFGKDKLSTLHSIDCLVLYSFYESWGLVVNEALASAIPVIVSDKVGARRDLVACAEPTGLVAKWDSVDDLARKMREMVDCDDMRRQFMDNALKIMSKWDYAVYGDNYDKWLGEISKVV